MLEGVVIGDRSGTESTDSKGVCPCTRTHCQRIRGWIRRIQVSTILYTVKANLGQFFSPIGEFGMRDAKPNGGEESPNVRTAIKFSHACEIFRLYAALHLFHLEFPYIF